MIVNAEAVVDANTVSGFDIEGLLSNPLTWIFGALLVIGLAIMEIIGTVISTVAAAITAIIGIIVGILLAIINGIKALF